MDIFRKIFSLKRKRLLEIITAATKFFIIGVIIFFIIYFYAIYRILDIIDSHFNEMSEFYEYLPANINCKVNILYENLVDSYCNYSDNKLYMSLGLLLLFCIIYGFLWKKNCLIKGVMPIYLRIFYVIIMYIFFSAVIWYIATNVAIRQAVLNINSTSKLIFHDAKFAVEQYNFLPTRIKFSFDYNTEDDLFLYCIVFVIFYWPYYRWEKKLKNMSNSHTD